LSKDSYLKLSLVSCPIALYPATSSSSKISFHRINKATGNRIRQQNVDAETGDVVERHQLGRGYEVAKGQHIEVSEEELEAIRIESTHTIDIDNFVPRDQVDERYINAPYYIAPTEKVGQEAFAVIREAIRGMGMTGLGRVVLARREHMMLVEPYDKGLLGTTLLYPYEVREAEAYFEDIPELKLPKEMIELARHIVETKLAKFEPATFHDHYEEALTELLKRKRAGKPVEAIGESKRPARVVNLMDALRKSIEDESTVPRTHERRKTATKHRAASARRRAS
jgi:DNA end-binding protein Ku